jgi:hypothetical protein
MSTILVLFSIAVLFTVLMALWVWYFIGRETKR